MAVVVGAPVAAAVSSAPAQGMDIKDVVEAVNWFTECFDGIDIDEMDDSELSAWKEETLGCLYPTHRLASKTCHATHHTIHFVRRRFWRNFVAA